MVIDHNTFIYYQQAQQLVQSHLQQLHPQQAQQLVQPRAQLHQQQLHGLPIYMVIHMTHSY